MENIVFLIPSTSRNCNYNNILDSSLIKTLYNSLKNYDITKYKFIIGFDDNDNFYCNNKNNLIELLPSNFHIEYINNDEKSYVCIVNKLAHIAINNYNAEYLYLIADDLIFYKFDYINIFIKYLNENNNIGLGWTDDVLIKRICTHPFVNKKHVQILGYFYPKEIKNWFCDDWITNLYKKINKIIRTSDNVLHNTIYAQNAKRYDIYPINITYLDNLVMNAYNIIINHL